MTPCEEKGYKVGDEFVVTEKTTFQKGARVRLSEDDRTNRPAFKGIGCKAVDGEDWHYIHLSRVRKVDNDDSIITRTNGQPFATEASARQQLTAKGLQGTHEVVSHNGGYALAPITHTGDPITLQPGDYVSTKDMTEEQYHAVARAFMEDGAESGEYPEVDFIDDSMGVNWAFGWNRNALWHGESACFTGRHLTIEQVFTGRHFTVDQVLGATNAKPRLTRIVETGLTARDLMQTADPITTLKQARQARDEAEQAYQEALGEAREYLGEGFELTEVGTDGPLVDGEDMTPFTIHGKI